MQAAQITDGRAGPRGVSQQMSRQMACHSTARGNREERFTPIVYPGSELQVQASPDSVHL